MRHCTLLICCALFASSAAGFERARSPFSAEWRWDQATVKVNLGPVEASGFPRELVALQLERAVAGWNNAGCGLTLVIAEQPEIEIRFVPELTQKKAADTLRFGDEHRGVMRRAEIELSGAQLWSDQAPLEPGALDLETLLIHELGHALGLAHSFVGRALMRAGAKPGRVARTLHRDDAAGLCSIYPP